VGQGFYPGGTAIAIRQMTNWASRQGFTEAVRDQFKLRLHGDKKARLTKAQEVASGILGGACPHFSFGLLHISCMQNCNFLIRGVAMLTACAPAVLQASWRAGELRCPFRTDAL
jgi:hypothetical protein